VSDVDAEPMKAPVPIERLAARLRAARRELAPAQTFPCEPATAATRIRYHAMLAAAAATMLETPAPRPPGGGPGAEWAEVEEALARAGLEIRGRAA
jgi:hypothetical protein